MALITKDYIIEEAFVRKISTSRISDSILLAVEIKYLKPILGKDFYDALVLTPTSYTALMVFIKPMLAWYSKYMLLPELKTEISDLGVNRINVQSAEKADEESYAQMRDQALIVAESRRSLLTEHLEDNATDYPLYYPSDNPDNSTEIVGGILFRKPAAKADTGDYWYDDK
jgi:hypothetical protein